MVDYPDHKRMYKKMGKEEGQTLSIDFGESRHFEGKIYGCIWRCFCRGIYN